MYHIMTAMCMHIAVVEEAALDRISPIVISLPHFSQSLVDW